MRGRFQSLTLAIALAGSSLLLACAACGERAGGAALPPEGAFRLESTAFQYGGTIPERYTCDGANLSPPLSWSNVPDGTVSFALIVEDPDAPMGTFTHWLVCDMPAHLRSLPEGAKVQGTEGQNDFRKSGYGGPCPPPGKAHRYYFRLYALDDTMDLPPNFTKHQLRAAMEGHILSSAELMGRYARRP